MNIKNKIPLTYAEKVLSGKILTSKITRLTIERHFNDLKKAKSKGMFFDEQDGLRVIEIFKYFRHFKGRQFVGKQIDLSPFQQFGIYALFGWKNDDQYKSRRFKYCYKTVAKKNGKTTEAAGLGLYMQVKDGEAAPEIYSIAKNKPQAKICFDAAKSIVKKSPALKSRLTVFAHNIHNITDVSKFEALCADEDQDGLNPHFVINDEYHLQRNAGLYNNMKSAMGSRVQPMIYTITTAGFNKEGPCYKLQKICIDILKGIKHDETIFPYIFTLDKNDEWDNEEIWVKSNPNLGISVDRKYLKDECQSAKNNPSEQVNFKTKNLNIWTDAPDVWIEDEKWMACSTASDLNYLKGRQCYGGLDLASTSDTNSLILLFPDDENDMFDILAYFWIPENKAKKKQEIADFLTWIQQGYVYSTPGDVVDHRFIIKKILELHRLYDIQKIGFDRAMAYSGIAQELYDNEVPLEEFGQGFLSMSEPTKEIERRALRKKYRHGGNPVLRWMNSNVVLRRDPAENIKIDKDKSNEKVDGMVSLSMANGMQMAYNGSGTSVYENRGIITI